MNGTRDYWMHTQPRWFLNFLSGWTPIKWGQHDWPPRSKWFPFLRPRLVRDFVFMATKCFSTGAKALRTTSPDSTLAQKLLGKLRMDGRVFSADWRSLHMCRNQYWRAVTAALFSKTCLFHCFALSFNEMRQYNTTWVLELSALTGAFHVTMRQNMSTKNLLILCPARKGLCV